jgi:hypothetical protein
VEFINRSCVASLLIILLLSSFPSKGQSPVVSLSCSQWVEISKVPSGGETVIAKDILLVSDDGGKTGLSIYSFLNSTRKVIVISVQALGAGGCVDKGDRILIIFENGSSMSLANMNDFNCDGASTLYFGGGLGKKDEFNLLTNYKVQSMTVWTRDSFMKKDFSAAKADAFRGTLKCLSDSLQ